MDRGGPRLRPEYLLAGARRVAAMGKARQRLFKDMRRGGQFGPEGARPAVAGLGPGERLHPRRRRPALLARALDAGQKLFWSPLYRRMDFLRPFIGRAGDKMVVLGAGDSAGIGPTPGQAMAVVAAGGAVVAELASIGTAAQHLSGDVEPAFVDNPLIWDHPTALGALAGDRLVVAQPGHLWRVNVPTLRLDGPLTADFNPVALSVDEGGWAYLVVDRPRELWVVSPEGKRTARFPLPRPLPATRSCRPSSGTTIGWSSRAVGWASRSMRAGLDVGAADGGAPAA